MATDVGRDPSGQALVASDGAAAHLHPSGFDPSRIAAVATQVDPERLAPIIRKAADEFYCTVLEMAQDHLRDNLDSNLKSHLSMLERENQRMRTELREIDRVVGPPWLTGEERMKRLREMDAALGKLIELRYLVQYDLKQAVAIATGTATARA